MNLKRAHIHLWCMQIILVDRNINTTKIPRKLHQSQQKDLKGNAEEIKNRHSPPYAVVTFPKARRKSELSIHAANCICIDQLKSTVQCTETWFWGLMPPIHKAIIKPDSELVQIHPMHRHSFVADPYRNISSPLICLFPPSPPPPWMPLNTFYLKNSPRISSVLSQWHFLSPFRITPLSNLLSDSFYSSHSGRVWV
jgi:hypothetical protein